MRERKNRNQATRKIGKVDSSATLTTSSGEHFDLKYQLRSEIFNSIVSDNETKDQGRSLSVMTVNGPQIFIILKKDVNYDAEGEPHVKIYLNGELVLDK